MFRDQQVVFIYSSLAWEAETGVMCTRYASDIVRTNRKGSPFHVGVL